MQMPFRVLQIENIPIRKAHFITPFGVGKWAFLCFLEKLNLQIAGCQAVDLHFAPLGDEGLDRG